MRVLILLALGFLKGSTALRSEASEQPDGISAEKCYAYINEINLSVPEETSQFVEIAVTCMNPLNSCVTIDMALFSILFINPKGLIVGVCVLNGNITILNNVEKYYTIGTQQNNLNIDYDISSCYLRYSDLSPTFPQGDTEPYGLALVYSQNTVERYNTTFFITPFGIGNILLTRYIDAQLQDRIMTHTQDFVVYASSSVYIFCDYYKNYYSEYTINNNPTLRDYHTPYSKDRSISRCDNSHLSFQSKSMKYSDPTPGKLNACQTAFSNVFESFKNIKTMPKAIFANDSSGCYSYNYNNTNDFYLELFSNSKQYSESLDIAENATKFSNALYPIVIPGNPLDKEVKFCSIIKNTIKTSANNISTSQTVQPSVKPLLPCSECAVCHKGKYLYSYFQNSETYINLTQTKRRRKRGSKKELCRTQFSELNSMTSHSTNMEFIEFRRICGPRGFAIRPSLDEHLLIFIEILEKPVVSFVAVLDGLKLVESPNKYSNNKLYLAVLGTRKYGDNWIFTNNPNVQYTSTNTNNILPDGQNSVVIAVLMNTQSRTKPYNAFKLSTDPVTNAIAPLALNFEMKSLIKSYAVDILVYAANPKYYNCELVHEITNEYKSKNYVLRDWNQASKPSNDYSIGRCGTDIMSFSPEMFKLGKPSPNAVNDCESSVNFLMDKELRELAQLAAVTVSNDIPNIAGCSAGLTEPRSVESVSFEKYSSAIEAKRVKYELSMVQLLETSQPQSQLETLPGLDNFVMEWHNEMLDDETKTVQFPWESHSHFDDSWILHVQREMSDLLDPLLFSRHDVKSWIQLISVEGSKQWKYNCRFCVNFFDNNNRLDRRGPMRRTEIMQDTGVLHVGQGAYSKNNKIIKDHVFSEIHLQAIEYLQERHISMFEGDNIPPKKDKYFVTNIQDEYFRSTINVFRLVFFRIKHNIPCHVYPSMIDLFRYFDINVGHKHYDETSCGLITRHIGSDMHQRLITHLLKENLPFTVLIDAASVGPKHHFLLFMMRTVENATPVTYLYRLLEIGSKSTAEGTWNSMQEAIELDGPAFVAFFKLNAVALAADGASVNFGIHNSIMTRFKAYINNKNVPGFHCISHKNQLIYRNAVDAKNIHALYVQRLESILNHVYSFYSIKSYKRNAHLKEFVESMNKVVKDKDVGEPQQPIKYIKLKRIFEVRWATSEAKVLESFFLMYEYVVRDLMKIVKDKHEPDTAIKKASKILNLLRDRTSLQTLAFLYDLTTLLSQFSLDSQKHDKIIIGVANSIIRLKQGLIMLKDNKGGTHSNKFMQEVFCHNQPQGLCTHNLYRSSWRVKYRSIILYNVISSDKPEFTTFVDTFMGNVLEYLDKHFNTNLYSIYDIFDPLKMPVIQNPSADGVPANKNEIDMYGVDEFIQITKLFGITSNNNDLKQSWNQLLNSILCLPIYEKLRADSPSVFWKKLLLYYPLDWNLISKKVIQGMLSLSVSTAIVESTFSIAEHIVTDKRRGNLGKDTIESMLTVRINARVHWSDWNPVEYVKTWLNSHLRTDHETHISPRARYAKSSDEDELESFKASSIF